MTEVAAVERNAHDAGCDQARAAGVAPIHYILPGCRGGMDGDRNEIACEPRRQSPPPADSQR